MADKIAGFLEVGHTDDTHEVVINHPDLKPDANGVGHIVFSPNQARNLSILLLRHANFAEDVKHNTVVGRNEAVEVCAIEARYWAQVENDDLSEIAIGAMGAASNICAALVRGISPEDYAKEVGRRGEQAVSSPADICPNPICNCGADPEHRFPHSPGAKE